MKSIIHKEHVYLNANFDSDTGAVLSYSQEPAQALIETTITDISSNAYFLISGLDGYSFSYNLCAGKKLEVGECQFEAVLSSDAHVMSIPLLMRTGNTEHVLIDYSERSDVTLYWLSYLSDSVANSLRELTIESASSMLVPFVLRGQHAQAILSDYLSSNQVLPNKGFCASIELDSIPCVIAHVPLDDDCYIVLVPPNKARVIWRSFLSFPVLSPLGTKALSTVLQKVVPEPSLLQLGEHIHANSHELLKHGYMRKEHDFIGANALFA